MTTLKQGISGFGDEVIKTFNKHAEALYEEIKQHSEEKAKEIKVILGKVAEILGRMADPNDKEMDKTAAQLAIRVYRQTVIAKGKALENFTKWRSYKTFWDFVKDFIYAVAKLLLG